MDLLQSLTAFGGRVGVKPILREKRYTKVFCLDLDTGALTLDKNVTIKIPQAVARGSNATTTPNRTFDFAKYVTDRKSAFWQLTPTIVQRSKVLTEAVETFLANSRWKVSVGAEDLTVTDGVGEKHVLEPNMDIVLMFGPKPLAEHKTVQTWLQAQSVPVEGSEDSLGSCLITGKRSPIARLHRGIRSSGDKLVSHNEASSQYKGLSPEENFPVSVETADLYSSGLSNLLDLRREPISSMVVAKDVALVLWPNIEGTTHPIIPAAITVLRMFPVGASKPEQQQEDQAKLVAAWTEIEAQSEDDPTDLCMAILGLRKIRYIPIAYGHTTVGKLRSALLKFRIEFDGSTFRQLSSIWLNSSGGANDNLIYDVLWSILTGRPYPLKITHLTGYEVTDYAKLRWLNAYNHRKGLPLMSFRNTNTDYQNPPTREQCYDTTLWGSQNKFYLLGQLVDVFCRLGQLAQHQDSVSPAVELRNMLGTPRRSYSRLIERGAFHIEKIRKKRRNVEWEAEFQRIVSDYNQGGIGTLPERLTPDERQLVTLGYMNQKRYSEHLLGHWHVLKIRKIEKIEAAPATTTPAADAAE